MRVLTTAFVLSALTLAAGCSSKTEDAAAPGAASGVPVAPVAAAASGSRLTVKFLTGGGAHQLVGFHDSMRNEDCTFQAAETPQKMRCLPLVAAANPSNFFSDAACQVAVAGLPVCGTDVKYGLALRSSGNCGQVVSELRKVLPASAPLYASGPNGCTVQPAPPVTQTGPVVALGDVVPWSDFVDATEMIIAGDGVSERVLVASDGARQHVGFHDPKLDLDCTFQLFDDLSVRCVPEVSTGPVLYSDAACATPFLVFGGPTGGGACGTLGPVTPNLWIEPALTACAGVRNLYSLRDFSFPASASDKAIYSYSIEGPSAGPAPPTPACNTAGNVGPFSNGNGAKAIDATLTASLPSVRRVSSGSDRLVPALVWPAGLATTLVPGWRDTERNVDCTFALAGDGKMRCLPVASSATLYHTDDACKSPGLLAILNQDSCFDSRSFAMVASATCPPANTVYALGAGASGSPGSIATATGRCAKTTGGATVMGALDATVADPTQFVEGVLSAE